MVSSAWGATTLDLNPVTKRLDLTLDSTALGNVSGTSVRMSGLNCSIYASNGTVTTNADGVFICADDNTGGGGTTHNILSSTHSDSTAGTVARGDLITGQGATATWSRLAIGAANSVQTSDGTDVAWSASPTVTNLTANNTVTGISGTFSGNVRSGSLSANTYVKTNNGQVLISQTTPLPVSDGGTGLSSGTSGGILGYTAAGTLASSAALTANALVLGGGAGTTPTTPVGLGTTTTLLHGNASGNPSFSAVSLTADVSGNLPVGNLNSGTGATGTAPATYWRGNATWASPQAFAVGGSDITSNTASFTMGVWDSNALAARVVLPASSQNCGQFVFSVVTAPGAGASWAATVQRAGVDTAITCTVSGTALICTYTGATVNFTNVIADRIDLNVVAAGTPAGNGGARWAMVCNGT